VGASLTILHDIVDIRARFSRLLSIFSDAHRFDWVVDGIAVGTDSVSAETLRANNIQCVVSVGASLAVDHSAETLFLSVQDKEPPSEEDALMAVKWVAQKRSQGKNVFIHCHAGMGRSATVTACYLVACGLTLSEALKILRERHPQTSPTTKQLEFLKAFESKHRGFLCKA